MLEISELTKSYDGRVVLNRVSFTARAGEVIGILGHSGAGKTTLFDLIAGTRQADAGDVYLDHVRITQLSTKERCASRIGHYAQETRSYPRFSRFFRSPTVEQSLRSELQAIKPFPALGRRLTSQEAVIRCHRVLQQFQLTHVAGNSLEGLASGERRRVELARCLLHEPRIILLDEPFAGMDPIACELLQSIIKGLQAADVTVLLTDQHHEHVLAIATRVIVVKEGRILTENVPDQIRRDASAQKNYFDAPALKMHYQQVVGANHPSEHSSKPGNKTFGIRELIKDYPRKRAVNGISLDVERGEIVGLLGPNGAGKTTVLRSSMGFCQPTAGTIYFDGHDITSVRPWKRSYIGLSYVSQGESSFRNLTVQDNLSLASRFRRPTLQKQVSSSRPAVNGVSRLLEAVQLNHIRRSLAGTLSGGERRRLEIACALARNPTILLLDEPFTGIDPVTIHGIQDLLLGQRDQGLGILLTDHRERETLTICDYSYILVEGKVLVSGDAEKVLSSEQAQQAYFGSRFDARSMLDEIPPSPRGDHP